MNFFKEIILFQVIENNSTTNEFTKTNDLIDLSNRKLKFPEILL